MIIKMSTAERKAKAKEIIQSKEDFYWNCEGRLCEYSVKVINLRERKAVFIADIIVHNPHENELKRFNDCEYKKEFLFRGEKNAS